MFGWALFPCSSHCYAPNGHPLWSGARSCGLPHCLFSYFHHAKRRVLFLSETKTIQFSVLLSSKTEMGRLTLQGPTNNLAVASRQQSLSNPNTLSNLSIPPLPLSTSEPKGGGKYPPRLGCQGGSLGPGEP